MTPDAGDILVKGERVQVSDPFRAAELGLAMVHQHFSLIGPLTVWENLTLGEHGRIDEKRISARSGRWRSGTRSTSTRGPGSTTSPRVNASGSRS
jgi:ABC-type uncharacterized transport system ATPase subunit